MGCEKFIKEKIATLPTIPKSPEDRSNIGVVYFYTFLKTGKQNPFPENIKQTYDALMKSSTPQTETITSPITTPASNSEPINPIKINIPQLTVPEVIPIPLKVELPPPLDPSAQIGERFYGKHGEKIYMSQQAEEQKQPTLEETLGFLTSLSQDLLTNKDNLTQIISFIDRELKGITVKDMQGGLENLQNIDTQGIQSLIGIVRGLDNNGKQVLKADLQKKLEGLTKIDADQNEQNTDEQTIEQSINAYEILKNTGKIIETTLNIQKFDKKNKLADKNIEGVQQWMKNTLGVNKVEYISSSTIESAIMKALQKGKLSNNKEYIFVKSSPVKSANVASNSLYQTANQIKNQVGDKSFPSNFMIEKDGYIQYIQIFEKK